MIASHGFKEWHEALVRQVAHLAIETAKVRRIDAVEVRESLPIIENLKWSLAVLVRHVLGSRDRAVGRRDLPACCPVSEFFPRVAQVHTVFIGEGRAAVIGLPVGKRCDETYGVVA